MRRTYSRSLSTNTIIVLLLYNHSIIEYSIVFLDFGSFYRMNDNAPSSDTSSILYFSTQTGEAIIEGESEDIFCSSRHVFLSRNLCTFRFHFYAWRLNPNLHEYHIYPLMQFSASFNQREQRILFHFLTTWSCRTASIELYSCFTWLSLNTTQASICSGQTHFAACF